MGCRITRKTGTRSAVVFALGGLLLSACATSGHDLAASYGNIRARESSLRNPAAGGDVQDRTYRNRKYAGVTFPAVVLEPAEVAHHDSRDPDYLRFLAGVRRALEESVLRGLLGSGRFGTVYPAQDDAIPADTVVCRIEALPHVTPSGNALLDDPVFGDERPKLIVVFTLELPTREEPLLKYTTWAVSEWEYGTWAMDDLLTKAVLLGNEFAAVLGRY